MSNVDLELIERCLAGDQAAWAMLIEQYSGLVYSIARKSGLRPDQCDDVAQVVFAILVRRLSGVRDQQSLAGWIATTARREAWRAKRGAAAHRTESGVESAELPVSDADLERAIRQAQLRSAVALLDVRCRKLIELLYLTDETPEYQQVAAEIGLAVGSIGPTRQRCLARLIEIIRQAGAA
ncbi:MAG: sigma-70 family RNA polymerase sigma factor [Phycisphaerae bacterium]|nr:sigma-70 family RNA polymerase sigma factor [Phycisphaerae bacterium]